MSSLNSSSSFSDEDIFFKDVPESCRKPKLVLQNLRDSMKKKFNAARSKYEEAAINEVSNIHSCEKRIRSLIEEVLQFKSKKYEITSNIMQVKQMLNELSVKKKLLEESNFDGVSQEEISEMLEQVVSLEKENEIKEEEMKKMKRVLVGQMCFYKEYLDIYIASTDNDDYLLYFRRTKRTDKLKPEEWIKIRTDNFKEYMIIDISLPEGTVERSKLMEMYSTGIPLKQFIYKARKFCLGLK